MPGHTIFCCYDTTPTIFYDLASSEVDYTLFYYKNEDQRKINNLNKVENLLLHLSSNWVEK